MAQVLAERGWGAWARALAVSWLPLDTLMIGYLAGVGLLVLLNRTRVPGAAALLALHAAGIALIFVMAGWERTRMPRVLWVFRHWYPLPYIAASYREMAVLIAAIRRADYDGTMALLDFRFWGVHPTVWLQAFHRPWLTEVLQWVYVLFFAAVLLVAGVLWRSARLEEYRYYAFVISLGFLALYVGYFLVPVRGPRFFLAELHRAPLEGLWLFATLHGVLDYLGSGHYDCFPSGHVAMTLLAWWGARRISPALGGAYGIYALCMALSTVYLRYHYTVDLLAGVLLALAVLAVAPRLYHGSRKGG